MTAKAYGLKLAEIQREKDENGKPDLAYVGRLLRLVPESGGEIVLQLTPSEVQRLADVLNAAMKTVEYRDYHWQNVATYF